MKFIFYFLLFILLFPIIHLTAAISYDVKFEGQIPPETLTLLKSASQLVSLQKSPPNTSAALRHRAEMDIPNLLKVLQSQAYYNATVTLTDDFDTSPAVIFFHINPGPVYPLVTFQLIAAPCEQDTEQRTPTSQKFPIEKIRLKSLGIELGRPAFPKTILDAEDKLLLYMAKKGYPLATIKKREVVADQSIQSISVTLIVDSGPPAYFGLTTITGQKNIHNDFFLKKIFWKEGELYDPAKVEKTQRALEASRLFSSINISHGEELTSNAELPMMIEVVESKHRSIGFGVSYTTIWGAGINFEWENRNIRNLGEKLSFNSDLRELLKKTTLRYVKPDFLRPSQDLILQTELQHEKTKGWTESSYSLSGSIERQLNARLRFSYGAMYKRLRDTHAAVNGAYNLFKIPLYLRWSTADDLLDPTRGITVNLKVIPSLQLIKKPFGYCVNLCTASFYHSLTKNHQYILALRASAGSIMGSSRHMIPTSERFYEGTENSLRGYRYMTVSPLNEHHKPIGGRSLAALTTELRGRMTENFGWVAFYDVGNVYEALLPELNRKLFTSIGCGVRYYTPVGPLRFDIAFPLSPRRHLDRRFQIYLSIGQAF